MRLVYFALSLVIAWATDQIPPESGKDETQFYREYLLSEFYLEKAESELMDRRHLLQLMRGFKPVPNDVEEALMASTADTADVDVVVADIDDPRGVSFSGVSRKLPKSIATQENVRKLTLIQNSLAEAGSEAFISSVVIPLYTFLCEAKFLSASPEHSSQDFTRDWLNLFAQLHYFSVLLVTHEAQDPETEQFKILSDFILDVLLNPVFAGARSAAIKPKMAANDFGPVTIGEVTVPAEVVNGGVQTLWCCLTACMEYVRRTTTTTTTTNAPTTVDPSIATKRKQELTQYLALVNASIDEINARLQKLKEAKISASEAALGPAVDALRAVIMEKYTGIVSAALLNEEFKVDLKPTQVRFLDMANSLGSFDPSKYDSIVSGVQTASTLLRQDLLQAAIDAK